MNAHPDHVRPLRAARSLNPLLDPKSIPLPSDLLSTRRRRMLSKAFAAWPEAGYMGLPVPRELHQDVLAAGGYVVDGDHGPSACIERRAVVQPVAQSFAPFVGQREIQPIVLQMAPPTSKADSLKSFLTPESWGALEDAAVEASGWVCEICGDGASRCVAHEIWSYRLPSNRGIEGVQRLDRLACLCSSCHEMMRPGPMLLESREADLIAWLMEVNEFDEEGAIRMLEVAQQRRREAARFEWVLDLSVLEEIEIDPSWRIDEKSWRLVPDDGGDTGGTLPLNVAFVHAGSHYPAADAQEYYDLLDRP